ncbi:unnamed protein product [Phytophthora lilii]|uniref:Unnamed protein product n=1 Tax=Phytophthora lilii TaxID=2077276 RepID=A0A9W6TCP2_9STRA|nr:unnamed protein product [Phytophthora lilii]
MFVYPVYLYGSAHVGAMGQTFYIVLLPIIKITARNWMSHFLDKNYDITPQLSFFILDIFHALCVSGTMQNSNSITTTLLFITLDAALAWISLSDQLHLVPLRRKIPTGHPMKYATFLKLAQQIIKEDDVAPQLLSLRTYSFGLTLLNQQACHTWSESSANPSAEIVGISVTQILPLPTLTSVEPLARPATDSFESILSERERRCLVQQTARVLLTSEFIMLVLYTKFIVPFIFGKSIMLDWNSLSIHFYVSVPP